ncbi:hypothetical protein ACFXTO_004795 [Malus domestica]
MLNIKQYSARCITRYETARLEAMLIARLLGYRLCSRRGGCSIRGDARCEAARLVVFLIASIYFMSTCTQYELILDMTRIRLLG